MAVVITSIICKAAVGESFSPRATPNSNRLATTLKSSSFPKYCSSDCQIKAKQRQREPKKCARCGKSFKPRNNKQKFCSKECYSPRKAKKCLFCKKTFIPITNQVFCSKKCSDIAIKLRRKIKPKPEKLPLDFGKKKCPECGEIFILKSINSTQKTCSPECKKKYVSRLKKTYHKKGKKNSNRNPIEHFSKGKIFILDMSVPEEKWTWEREDR